MLKSLVGVYEKGCSYLISILTVPPEEFYWDNLPLVDGTLTLTINETYDIWDRLLNLTCNAVNAYPAPDFSFQLSNEKKHLLILFLSFF